MYLNKLVVLTGSTVSGIDDTTQVIDLDHADVTCDPLEDFPEKLQRAFGALWSEYSLPIVCGGMMSNAKYSDRCYELGNPDPILTLSIPRSNPGVVILANGQLWITGGFGGHSYGEWLTTSEIISPKLPDKTTPGPELPAGMMEHCATALNDTSVMLIGAGAAYIYHFDQETWTNVPALNMGVSSIGCGLIITTDGAFSMVFLTGGRDSYGFINHLTHLWSDIDVSLVMEGSPMPQSKAHGAGVSTLDKKSYYFIGGRFPLGGFSDTILKLQCDSIYFCQWNMMAQVLNPARSDLVVFLVPDNLVKCTSNSIGNSTLS